MIVDDASKDKSWHYLTSLKDKRIKLIKNKKNLGLAKSLNLALSKAKGDFIARMDSDDISLPKRFEIQMGFLEKNPDTDICGGWANLIDSQGKFISIIKKPTQDAQIKTMNRWITGIIHPTWFVRRKVFSQLGGYNVKYDLAEDYDFLIRAKKFQMANIAKVLLLWRSPKDRRSKKNIENMYRQSLAIRWNYFKSGELGLFYLPFLIRSLITTYLFPTKLKIFLNQRAGLI